MMNKEIIVDGDYVHANPQLVNHKLATTVKGRTYTLIMRASLTILITLIFLSVVYRVMNPTASLSSIIPLPVFISVLVAVSILPITGIVLGAVASREGVTSMVEVNLEKVTRWIQSSTGVDAGEEASRKITRVILTSPLVKIKKNTDTGNGLEASAIMCGDFDTVNGDTIKLFNSDNKWFVKLSQ